MRIAAILAIRQLVSSTDDSIMDTVLKVVPFSISVHHDFLTSTLQNIYLALVRSSKTTTAHTIPAITLMKNSASEIYCLDHSAAYQHAFGYIRQLAIHLRNSMKVKTKVRLFYAMRGIHNL